MNLPPDFSKFFLLFNRCLLNIRPCNVLGINLRGYKKFTVCGSRLIFLFPSGIANLLAQVYDQQQHGGARYSTSA
jgi:hypothetical protein